MKTVVQEAFGPPADLITLEIDTPQPGPGEVLVKVNAAGVGFVDGLMVQGLYQVKPPLPYYPGSEFAGEIAVLGADVEDLAVGDRVMGMAGSGAFSEFVCARAAGVVRLSDKLPGEIAAGFYANYATALYGLRDCGAMQPGETILILGAAGGVGSAAICVAKAMGATVIAAASSAAKREAAVGYGADHAVDYTAENWRDEVKALTQETGLNLVYDPVGGDYSDPAFRSLSPGGRFLVVGFAAGTIPAIRLNLALLKRSSIVGVDWGGEARANPKINGELIGELMQWVESGKLEPAPVTIRSMQDVREALADQLAGKIIGKLVLSQS